MKSEEFKNLIDILKKNGIICKEINILPIKTRKKVDAFLGINLKNEYCFILKLGKKSRFLSNDIDTLYEFMPKEINFRYKKKILILNEICSKTKAKLKDWKIIDGIG